MKKNIFNLVTSIFLLLIFQQNIFSQTLLIDPAGDGGFTNGSTFAANGWTDANSTNNPWVIGTAIIGTPYSGNSAYVSTDGGTTFSYNNASPCLNFFYRDITVPAGESKIILTFNWICNGESTWDLWQVFTAPTSIVPIGSTTYPGSGTNLVPSAIAGATFIGYGNLQTTAQTATLVLPPSLAGTTFRLILGWKSDTSGGTNPPAGIDNISLVSSLPTPLIGGNIYPINGTQNPPISFASITTAAAYLSTDGVTGTGQVILELSTGYAGEPGPVSINSIAGASSTIGVTFRPATGYTALTTIPGGASPNQHAIKINACSYVTLDGRGGGIGTSRDWTVRVTGSGTTGLGQMAVRMDNTNGNMTGNTVKYLIMEGEAANATGAIFQITGSTTNTISNIIIENNLLQSTSSASTSLRGYGITLAVASNVGNTGIIVRNNDITMYHGRGINITGGFPGIEVYGNNIYHTVAITQPTTIESAGIYFSTSASAGAKIYNNYIRDLQFTNGLTAINGIQLLTSNSTGIVPAFFNNRISIGAGITATTVPIYGVNYSSSTATYPYDFYFNSVLINGSATAGATNSAAFRKAAGNVFNLKNNIFYNTRTNSGGTGTHWGISLNNTTFTSINNNDYFADGTGGVLGTTDGTTTGNKTTLTAWKAAVPADANSVSQNPNYITGLKIDASIPTQLESGGTPITGIITDFEGDTRNATTPDVGADEFAGIPVDLSPPVIVYTPLLNTSSLSNRTLNATIIDPGSGVPTAGVGLPVLYWKINTAGIWFPATSVFLSGSNYQFTFGSGTVAGDTVFYYVVAQDGAIPPNVGAFPSVGAGGFTANPPAAATPPTTPSSYRVTQSALAGDYTVGLLAFNMLSGRNIVFEKSVLKVIKEVIVEEQSIDKNNHRSESESTALYTNGVKKLVEVEEISWIPMESGQVYEGDLFVKKVDNPSLDFPAGIDGIYATITAAVADLNLRGVSGPVNFLLTDATYLTETLPITVNITNESLPTALNTVTIKPNTGVTAAVSGAAAASQIFKILNSYITINGSNSGGTTRDLTIENTSVTTPQVIVLGSQGTTPITNAAVRNCNIINGINTSTPLIVSDGNAPGTAGWFNNITIQNNSIQKAYIGNYNIAVVSAGNGSGLNIVGNDISTVGANSVRFLGIYVQGVDGATITDNHIANFDGATSEDDRGIWLATGTVNTVIERNLIHTLKYTGTGGYGAHGMAISTATLNANNTIKNNVIYDLSGDGWNYTSIIGDNPHGIYIFSTQSGINVYYNSINLFGNTLNQASAMSTGICLGTGSIADLRDNNIVNSLGLLTATGYGSTGIFLQTAASQLALSNYNNIFVNPTGSGVKNVGQIAATGYTTLSAWQAATTQDANSISADPLYQSATDLRPAYNSPVIGAGTPIAGITTDYLGVTRSATTPTIGAYEQGVIIPIAAGTYTVGLSDFIQATGKKIYFETRTRTIVKDLLGVDADIDILAYDEKNGTPPVIDESQRYITVTEEYLEMMEDGKPFDYSFFKSDQSMGVYPTITSAIADLVLRGIAGAVTFLLVDTNYPTETYPLLIPAIAGASATNTITFKPGPGVQANIPGSITQTTSTFQLGGADYVIVDGSNTVSGTTKDLHITCPLSFPAFHFFGGSSHNMIMNTIFDSKNTGTGSGTFLFGATASGDSNYVENCSITKSDTSAVKHAVAIYFFSSNTSTFNRMVGNEIYEFSDYGIRVQGAPSSNNLIKGNNIYHLTPSTKTTNYGIYISRQPGLVIEENYIKNLRSTVASPTLTAIYYLGSSGNPVDIYVRNNVISLSAEFNSPAGTLRGIDYYAFAANSAEIYFNTIYIAGTGVTGGTTTGLSKRDAATVIKMYDNAVYNTRSNGTGTGKHYAVYFSNTTAPFEMNNNDYFADGAGGVLGYFGTADVLTIAAWQTATGQDANSISANPFFVSNLDYRPQTVSPLLGAGLPITGITTDILGALRGTPPTIGAYEIGIFVAINSPSNLTAIPDTFTVDLGWQDNSSNEFGFVIQRKLGDSLSVNPWINIDTVNANVINYLDTGLSPNTLYSYRAFGYNTSGNSGFSNIVEVTTFIPVELSAFTAEVTGREILVSWITATELNNRGFDIERNMNGEWEKIGFKDGKGTTTEESYYSFIDKYTYESFVGTINYRLKQMDFDGTYAYSPEVEVSVDFTPKEYTLYQNYPNPFNPVTTIKYSLPFESNVRIAVYNILGEMIDVLVDETKAVGFHDFNWNASNLASGIYIYTIEAKSVAGDKNYSSVKKMILMK
jgi:hypothetical protein